MSRIGKVNTHALGVWCVDWSSGRASHDEREPGSDPGKSCPLSMKQGPPSLGSWDTEWLAVSILPLFWQFLDSNAFK